MKCELKIDVGPTLNGGCLVCSKAVKKDEIAFTFRLNSYSKEGISIQPRFGMHKTCFLTFIAQDEWISEEYDRILEKVKNEGKLFDD